MKKVIFFICLALVGIIFFTKSNKTLCADEFDGNASCPSGAGTVKQVTGYDSISSVFIRAWVNGFENAPPNTRITMYIGNPQDRCSDVNCLLRNESASITWDPSQPFMTIDLHNIGCSENDCVVDGHDWTNVLFVVESNGQRLTNCTSDMSYRDSNDLGKFVFENAAEMRGKIDLLHGNGFSREINVWFSCPSIPPTNTPIPPRATPTNTPIPTRPPTVPPQQPTPTVPPVCPVPQAVTNVKVSCPICEQQE